MAERSRGPGRRRRFAALATVALLAPGVAACGGDDGGVPVINVYYSTEQSFQKLVDDCNQQAQGRYRMVYQVLPRAADEQRVQMVRRLAAEDDGMDVLGLDVTWTAEFASAKWIREWTGAAKDEASRGTLQQPLESATYEGKLFAAPKNTNTQLLWYRSDLVPNPPKTWDEMIQMSQDLKSQGKPYEIDTMGAQYEGLVVLYNNMVASAGGKILNDDGNKVEFDQGAVDALGTLQKFASSGVTNPSFTNTQEDAARLQFQGGSGAFQLNYPFVWPALQEGAPDLKDKVKWARYPGIDAGTPSKVTIGGFNLAVSTYSKHPEEAFEAALCLRSPEHQLFSAVNDGVPPTVESVYDDPQMDEAYPFKDDILAQLKDGSNRPVTPAYQNLSTVLSATLSPPADIRPEQDAEQLRGSIQDALESKGVLP
ncbi:ABC transporter substrate-binding protein [Asanoa siamensis]|uniref:Sugar ABC transporter substrate-binding protein n=1 Tax=Asanoa siamensis TaxID=926357 RepID=A0ABQ4CNL9_9ACTN|nr:ABC transporter substrate-binding protein [Asanoa siamensis]GIF72442.1 sugar ABC transporter substrate-binding protein [Asanoa siamensis]